jgi:thioredoxin 1
VRVQPIRFDAAKDSYPASCLIETVDDPELAEIRARKLQQLLTSASAPRPSAAEWSGPVTLTDLTFDAEVRRPGAILVDFWAEWCGPCHRVAPVLEEVARARGGRLRLGKLNIDENPRTPARFQIMSIPTVLLFINGSLVDGIVGAVPKAEIESTLTRHI